MPAIFGKGLNPATESSINRELSRLDRSGVITLTASATIRPEHSIVLANTTSGSVTVTLPPARDCKGREYKFKKLVAANTMTLDAYGSETIDGAATQAATTQYGSFVIVSDGTGWHIF